MNPTPTAAPADPVLLALLAVLTLARLLLIAAALLLVLLGGTVLDRSEPFRRTVRDCPAPSRLWSRFAPLPLDLSTDSGYHWGLSPACHAFRL